MRPVAMFLLVFVGGCSLLWPMDDYDATPRATRDDGGASSSSGATSSSSGTASGTIGEAGADGGVINPSDCTVVDPEPNDSLTEAVEVHEGVTCGVIVSPGDLDYFTFDGKAGPASLVVDLEDNVQLTVTAGANSGFYQKRGRYPFQAGETKQTFLFQSFNGSAGVYSMTRE